MARICKDHDWESCKHGNWSSPFEDANRAAICECVAFDVVSYYQDD